MEVRSSRAGPKVSIGLAVYNGEEFLEQAIQSILDQTYTDFELVVSDNASTDRTAEIAKRLAANDARVRYSLNPTNIGGARNENLTFSLTSGTYFRWAAHDDYLEPLLLERCVETLENDPECVLCYTQVRQVDLVQGTEHIVSRNNADSARPATRFRRIIMSKEFLEETYGLIRRDVLERTNLQADYTASDRTLIAEISLYGRFREVPEPLFVKRLHKKNDYVDWRTRIAWFEPTAIDVISFPWWAQLEDLIRTIRHADVTRTVKLECFASISLWSLQRSPNLAKDVVLGIYAKIRGRSWRTARLAATKNWD